MNRLPAMLLVSLCCFATLGCASIPLDPVPAEGCEDAPEPGGRYPNPAYCEQRVLVVGLFPTIGEHHLNDLSTKGMPLTPTRRAADLTLFPALVSFVNFSGLGLPSLYSLIYEPFQEYHQSPGTCAMTLLGFCKASRSYPKPGYVAPAERETLTPMEASEEPEKPFPF